MEQNAKRAGRQTQEFYPEPDGTECHKSRETSPVTLPRTRWWWNRMPKEQGDKPRNSTRNQMEQNAKRLGRQAPEPYPKPKNHDGTKMVSWKNWEPPVQLQSCLEKKKTIWFWNCCFQTWRGFTPTCNQQSVPFHPAVPRYPTSAVRRMAARSISWNLTISEQVASVGHGSVVKCTSSRIYLFRALGHFFLGNDGRTFFEDLPQPIP